jgi:dihydroflavonol-4-reductase
MNLVTGATGHIGNVLVRQLLASGQPVRAVVRPGKIPHALQNLEVEIVPGDVLDPGSLVRAMQGVRVVYHLAARINLGSEPDPDTERVNLGGTLNLLTAMRDSGNRGKSIRLVYASSIYALRTPEHGVVDEACPFDPSHARGIYDHSKAEASLEVQKAAAGGLDAVLVCPTAVTGPFDFQVSEAGRGIQYNMSPGIKFYVDGAYDFVDVRDVAKGIILAARQGHRGETYILGGEKLSVREVSEIIWENAGGWHLGVHLPDWVADLAAEALPFFTGDPIVTQYTLGALRSNSSISHAKASQELGYLPRSARQAIADAVAWWQERSVEQASLPETIARATT